MSDNLAIITCRVDIGLKRKASAILHLQGINCSKWITKKLEEMVADYERETNTSFDAHIHHLNKQAQKERE